MPMIGFCEHAISKLLEGFNNDKVAMVFGNWNIIDSHGNYLYTYKRHDFQKDVTLLGQPGAWCLHNVSNGLSTTGRWLQRRVAMSRWL
jgi:hypothetical protein